MGKLSRAKGRTFEQVIARRLRPLFGDSVKRGYQRRGGKEACDVEGTPFWIECKHGKAISLRAALAQAICDTDDRPCVVVAKDDGWREPVVVMRFEDWLDLARRELTQSAIDALQGKCDATAEET